MSDNFSIQLFILCLIFLDLSPGTKYMITNLHLDIETLSECCVRCLSYPKCQSAVYNKENATCLVQGGDLGPLLLTGFRKYLMKQLQNCSSRIVYYKFSRYTLKMSLGQRANFTNETASTAGNIKDPRILLISKSRQQVSYQMDLSNTSHLSQYNHLKQQKVSALVYLGSTKKLLVSNKEKNKIYAYSLDSSNFSVVVSNHSTEQFGLDESRCLIFFYSKKLMSKHGCLVRMQDNGSNLTIIKRLQGQVARSHVTVERRNRKLYMNVKYSSIDVYSYSGHLEGQLFADTPDLKSVRILAFDQATLDLYYIEDKTLFKVSLEDKRPSEIHKLKHNARQLVKHMGKLYVALMRKGYLYVVNQDKLVQMIKLNFDTYDDWNMCIVS